MEENKVDMANEQVHQSTGQLLQLAPDVTLPLETVTARVAALGMSGSGKTHTASVLVEEMLAAGAHVAVLDPLGVWWGLRAAAEGTDVDTLPIYILGGDHADLPLDRNAGAAIADLLVDERLSAVLDLSHLEQDAQAAFAADFAERLYERNRVPFHLVIDEADVFAPETPGGGEEWRSRRALDRIVRRGRVRGMGVTLISQRPAVVAKNLLSQIGTLLVHRLAGPQDLKAVDGWLKSQASDAQRKEVLSSLPSLAVGEAWLYSPSELAVVTRVRVRLRRTYDSSATPKMGETRLEPRTLHAPDLAALAGRLALVQQETEDNKPENLKAQIAQLKQQLADAPTRVETVVEEKRVEVPVVSPADLERMREMMDTAVGVAKDLMSFHAQLRATVERFTEPETQPTESVQLILQPEPVTAQKSPPKPQPQSEPKKAAAVPSAAAKVQPSVQKLVTEGQRALLRALAEFGAVGLNRVTRENAAIWADRSPKSSAVDADLKRLRELGLLTYPSGGTLELTAMGQQFAGAVPAVKSGAELLSRWAARLPAKQAEMLRVLCGAYPSSVSRAELARAVGASPTSSATDAHIKALSNLGLVDYPRSGSVAATALLFPPGLE